MRGPEQLRHVEPDDMVNLDKLETGLAVVVVPVLVGILQETGAGAGRQVLATHVAHKATTRRTEPQVQQGTRGAGGGSTIDQSADG